jgi:hypothetical protein
MKNQSPSSAAHPSRRATLILALTVLLTSLATLTGLSQSGNLLQDGNFNGAFPGPWTTWMFGPSGDSWVGISSTPPTDDGTAFVYMGSSDGGAGCYQIVFGVPNVPYTVSCASGVQNWWWPAAEMRMFFLDVNTNTLIEYVTNCAAAINSYDTGLGWSNYTMTGTSPAGTTQVKIEFACPNGDGTVWFDNASLTAPLVYPTIGNMYPDGTTMMQATNAFAFTAASTTTPVNASGIQVIVNGVDVSSSLTITGSSMSKNVVYSGITSNNTYTATIKVADANGLIVTKSLSFDTFSPSYYTWEAEDWDFNGGHFIDNPQLDAYYGNTNGVPDSDYYEISTGTNSASWSYRPWDVGNPPLPQTEITGDVKRTQYIAANTNDYDVGWFDAGEWLNYTRTYPTGLYNIWARMASPGASTLNLSKVTAGLGTTNQTTVSLGNFAQVGGLGWSSFSWVPLTDASGNMVKVSLGGVATLRATSGGNANFNFCMLVPANTNVPVIAGIYPNGSTQFQATNSFTFTATSAAGINASSIQVALSVTNATLHYTTNLTSANGLTVTGTANNRIVNYPGLVTNAIYSAIITVTDINNDTVSINPKFDTYSPVMTWEAEDWDYNGGKFINNPGVDAYANLVGDEGVDYFFTNTGGTRPYRPLDGPAAGIAGDVPRTQYVTPVATNDYAVGYFSTPQWINYTRNFPAGTYNIYGRFATTAGGDSYLNLGEVTNGAGTASQSVQPLGSFTIADTGGWSTYRFTPLRDQFGNLVQVTLNGQTTLQFLRNGGADANINFFMLLPAVTSLPTITQVTPTGPWLQSVNKLQFVASGTAGIAASNVVVTLNGVKASNLTLTGSTASWAASCPLVPSTVYTAVITVTDNAGEVATTTANFDTFSAGSYTWEAEDYDYSGGQFIDNPQVDGYAGDSGTSGVDYLKVSAAGGSYLYRGDTVETEDCGDYARSQFTSVGGTDYDVGYNGTGDWWNYTRNFPAGKYNVYLRAARGAGGNAPMGLQKVTSGWGTATQTTTALGSFSVPNTGGWQTYAWVPLVDANTNLVTVSLNGSTNTLRLTDGGANLNFLELVPAWMLSATANGANVSLSFGTQSGFNYTVFYKNSLTNSAWTTLSTVAGNDAVQTVTDSRTASSRFYRLQIH